MQVTCKLHVKWLKFHMWYISDFTCDLRNFVCASHANHMQYVNVFACEPYMFCISVDFRMRKHLFFACESHVNYMRKCDLSHVKIHILLHAKNDVHMWRPVFRMRSTAFRMWVTCEKLPFACEKRACEPHAKSSPLLMTMC